MSDAAQPAQPAGRSGQNLRRLRLCADDYGISPAVSRGIRELIERRRINATSVMVVAPSFCAVEADALKAVAHPGLAIGLHFTLTAPFFPASSGFHPVAEGCFPSLPRIFATGLLRRLDAGALAREAASQFSAFHSAFGRSPDYVDGHQHVQLLPQVADAVLAMIKRAAPRAWARQCGRTTPLPKRMGDLKGLFLDALSTRFRARSRRAGIPTNPAFAGTYDFSRETDYAALFPAFLDGLPEGGLVMCHPGEVDDELRRLDSLTTMREREYAFFAGDDFLPLLARHGFALG